jgi:hypothetical protein
MSVFVRHFDGLVVYSKNYAYNCFFSFCKRHYKILVFCIETQITFVIKMIEECTKVEVKTTIDF